MSRAPKPKWNVDWMSAEAEVILSQREYHRPGCPAGDYFPARPDRCSCGLREDIQDLQVRSAAVPADREEGSLEHGR